MRTWKRPAVLVVIAGVLALLVTQGLAADLDTLKDDFKKTQKKYVRMEKEILTKQQALAVNEAEFNKTVAPIAKRGTFSSQAEKDKFVKWEQEILAQRKELGPLTAQKMVASEDYEKVIVEVLGLDTLKSVKFIWNEVMKKGLLSYPELNGCEKGVAALSGGESIDFLTDKLRSASEQVKILLCRAFGSVKSEKVVDALLELLAKDRRHNEIVSAAAGALRHHKAKKAILPLIEMLKEAEKKKETRLAADLRDALRGITGKNDFNFASDFESWWENKGKNEKLEEEDDDRVPTGKVVPKGSKLSTYLYGEITSKRVIFILDRSHSMSAEGTVPEKPDLTTGTGDDEGPMTGEKNEQEKEKEKEDVNEGEGGVGPGFKGTRLAAVKKEFKFILEKLPEDTMFNIIYFNHDVLPCFKKLTKASEKKKKKALKFVETLQPESATNSYGSLAAALSDKNVDTIYFLTDGAPTAGTPRVPDQICAQIKQLNQKRNVRIHCIALVFGVYRSGGQTIPEDKATMKSFLEKLAKENDGTYRVIED